MIYAIKSGALLFPRKVQIQSKIWRRAWSDLLVLNYRIFRVPPTRNYYDLGIKSKAKAKILKIRKLHPDCPDITAQALSLKVKIIEKSIFNKVKMNI